MREQSGSGEQNYPSSDPLPSLQAEEYTKKLNLNICTNQKQMLKEIQIAQHVKSLQQNAQTKKDLQNVISVWRTFKEAESAKGQIVMERGEIDGEKYFQKIIINSNGDAEKCTQIAKVIIEHAQMGLKGLKKYGVKFSDLKLRNIVKTKDGTWKIIDFGKAELHQKIQDIQLQEDIEKRHLNSMETLARQIAQLIQIHGKDTEMILVDDKSVARMSPRKQKNVNIFTSLQGQDHCIDIIKINENHFEPFGSRVDSQFGGIEVDGKLVSKVQEKDYKFEFYGDSLTSAFGVNSSTNLVCMLHTFWDYIFFQQIQHLISSISANLNISYQQNYSVSPILDI